MDIAGNINRNSTELTSSISVSDIAVTFSREIVFSTKRRVCVSKIDHYESLSMYQLLHNIFA